MFAGRMSLLEICQRFVIELFRELSGRTRIGQLCDEIADREIGEAVRRSLVYELADRKRALGAKIPFSPNWIVAESKRAVKAIDLSEADPESPQEILDLAYLITPRLFNNIARAMDGFVALEGITRPPVSANPAMN